MNIREGMRRVGILLGIAGALLGCAAAYPYASELWRVRSTHERFESLTAAPTMRKIAQASREFQHSHALQLRPDSWSGKVEYDGKQGTIRGGWLPDINIPDHPDAWKAVQIFKLSEQQRKAGVILVSVNLEGIKEVTVEYDGRVSALDLSNDDVVFPVAAPHLIEYLLLLAFPLGGFVVAWGCIRVLAWVGTGFAASRA